MAAHTQLSVAALPGKRRTFSAKAANIVVNYAVSAIHAMKGITKISATPGATRISAMNGTIKISARVN